jgi:hypothetical protein
MAFVQEDGPQAVVIAPAAFNNPFIELPGQSFETKRNGALNGSHIRTRCAKIEKRDGLRVVPFRRDASTRTVESKQITLDEVRGKREITFVFLDPRSCGAGLFAAVLRQMPCRRLRRAQDFFVRSVTGSGVSGKDAFVSDVSVGLSMMNENNVIRGQRPEGFRIGWSNGQ